MNVLPAARLGLRVLLVGAIMLVSASSANAQEASPSAFDRNFALGGYVRGSVGGYQGIGGGGRARWEPFDSLGVDVFGDWQQIDDPDGFRHDTTVGFDLYRPIGLPGPLRLKPFLGFCSSFSVLHPQGGAERISNVNFGVHAGAGIEIAVGSRFSLFFDAKGVLYFGNPRTYGGWTVQVGEQISAWGVVQGALGLQVHL